MKAAVLHAPGVPVFAEFPDPEPQAGHVVLDVTAAPVNAIDVRAAAGTHYLSPAAYPVVPGIEGVGTRPDGRRVHFSRPAAPFGSLAERTLVPEHSTLPLPDGIDDAIAVTAAGNAGLAALMPLSWRAALQPGETVLILGATGVVGRLAVQVARLLGAGRIVAAGRDPQALDEVVALGADVAVPLLEDDPTAALREAIGGRVDVILDYLWGPPARAALQLASSGTRLVQIGDRAGDTLALDAQLLRRTGVTVSGFMPAHAGPQLVAAAANRLLAWAADGRLRIDVETLPLSAVADAWSREPHIRHKIVLCP